MSKFPHYSQLDARDCGPTCLRMIAKYYGKDYSLETLRNLSFISRTGVSMLGISEAAESIGFKTAGIRITLKQLEEAMCYPCILHWNQKHFVVCYGVSHSGKACKFHIADPANKNMVYSEKEMMKCWITSNSEHEGYGTALLLEPTRAFYSAEDEHDKATNSLSFIFKYIRPYWKGVTLLLSGMFVACVLQLIFPFLSQALVDIGIHGRNISLIALILAVQMFISISHVIIEFIRNWILLHINTRVNIALISDFLIKLMKLPLSFFDSKNIGDILQRIADHSRIESFLTSSTVSTIFSFVNFLVFAIVLAVYNPSILFVYMSGNILYIIWVTLFMKYRRDLDIRRFEQAAGEQSNLIQMINGMQEIKLNNCETLKRWQWERIQVNLFKTSIKGQYIGQIQQSGSIFFSQSANIIISYLVAKGVVNGTMTLGMMVSISYIVGALNGPINSFIEFIKKLQDAKISLERLNEIHNKNDEEEWINNKISKIEHNLDIVIDNLSFSYSGLKSDLVFEDINIRIPSGKVTAIVGPSGGGKTTLIKLMLGFYKPLKGRILIGDVPLDNINHHVWRNYSGAVMQDGFIFSDTIANNIALGDEKIDEYRLKIAAETANIHEYISSLPLGYDTVIGMEGKGLSQGQKQRILIARNIYKDPYYLFLDESTNALDANNERKILANLKKFYKGKTVVVVAHRLSTVCDADNIIVIDKGRVVEQGVHSKLVEQKGKYYTLIKNQLELGL